MVKSDQEKLDKKKQKAAYKLEKKRAKKVLENMETYQKETKEKEINNGEELNIRMEIPEKEEVPWYKNPDWIRAIAAIITMIIVILTFYLTFN